MSAWNRNKVDPSQINNGKEFTKDSVLTVDELNSMVNNSFYASDKAQRAEELAESAVKGQGTPIIFKGEVLSEWSADFIENEKEKANTLGQILHEKELSNYFGSLVIKLGAETSVPNGGSVFGGWSEVEQEGALFSVDNTDITCNFDGYVECYGVIQAYVGTDKYRLMMKVSKNMITMGYAYKDFTSAIDYYSDQLSVVPVLFNVVKGDLIKITFESSTSSGTVQPNSTLLLRGVKKL